MSEVAIHPGHPGRKIFLYSHTPTVTITASQLSRVLWYHPGQAKRLGNADTNDQLHSRWPRIAAPNWTDSTRARVGRRRRVGLNQHDHRPRPVVG